MKPFVINHHGRIVFPFNFFPDLDFTVFDTLEQFAAVIKRDFDEKAPPETEVVARLQAGKYTSRFEICRDLALDLFWVNRYAMTMYEKRPMRWRDVPRQRDDVFLPVYRPWDVGGLAAAIEAGYYALPAQWDPEAEDRSFRILLDVFRNKPGAGAELPPVKPTVPEMLLDPGCLTLRLMDYDPDFPRYSYDDILDCAHPVPEIEALLRQAMVLHNQYPWNRGKGTLSQVGSLGDDDFVVTFHPRNHEVLQFLRRVKAGGRARRARPASLPTSRPVKPYPPVEVRQRFAVMPRVEAIAVYEGEVACTNEDLIRNHAYCWSRMTAAEILEKTGIAQRLYSELDLEHMALLSARAALDKAGRRPEEIAAVLFCTCTSTKLIPSIATWLSGELGLFQTHASCDIVAACAGMPYGLAEAVRLLQEVERPVLVICAEKFSDKIGTVRTSRMIFGDGAATAVVGPAPAGAEPDIEVVQTYASGPWAEVNSIIWPNPEFDNNITVYGPEVKALVKRYLTQMIGELTALPHPDGGGGTLMDAIDLVVPHQANKNMVVTLAQAAGIPPERMYFNIERVGNTSAASILLAIRDAVRQGRIDRPMRVFAPGFGAGAVGGYTVMRVDPAVIA
jgi:3-oxoacyl-[acyl-carrier-protein] synthase III